MPTIFLHETHEISGGRMHDFEAAFRSGWVPAVERAGDARLLWFWHHTHGTGPSYQAISITAFNGWRAWEGYVERTRQAGELHSWLNGEICSVRREVTGKLLLPTSWSPLAEVDFSKPAPKPAADAKPAIYLHDTGWPFAGCLTQYVEALGSVFFPQAQQSKMISIEACWTTCPGTGKFHEVLLLQKIHDWPRFSHLLTDGEGAARGGDWMVEGLKHRDRWESKLLRTALWSPVA